MVEVAVIMGVVGVLYTIVPWVGAVGGTTVWAEVQTAGAHDRDSGLTPLSSRINFSPGSKYGLKGMLVGNTAVLWKLPPLLLAAGSSGLKTFSLISSSFRQRGLGVASGDVTEGVDTDIRGTSPELLLL